MAAKRRATEGARAGRAAARGEPAAGEVRELLQQLVLLTAVNNVMAQTAFLSVERVRVSSEVVDERVTRAFGDELLQRCEQVVRASDDIILGLLDGLGEEDARADLVRSLVRQRRQLAEQRAGGEQPRLVESLERMYR